MYGFFTPAILGLRESEKWEWRLHNPSFKAIDQLFTPTICPSATTTLEITAVRLSFPHTKFKSDQSAIR